MCPRWKWSRKPLFNRLRSLRLLRSLRQSLSSHWRKPKYFQCLWRFSSWWCLKIQIHCFIRKWICSQCWLQHSNYRIWRNPLKWRSWGYWRMVFQPHHLRNYFRYLTRWLRKLRMHQNDWRWWIHLVMYDGLRYLNGRNWIINLFFPHYYHLIQSIRKHLDCNCHQKWSSRRLLWKCLEHRNFFDFLYWFHL